MRKVGIIGGGIAGLSAAYYLQQAAERAGQPLEVHVYESGTKWGGKIITDRVDGFVVEGGPDTFVVTKPWAVQLCKELGIYDRLRGTNPQTRNTYILLNNQLHPLPGGLTMMIPTEIGDMLRSRLLTWSDKLRMGVDFVLPPARQNGDETLGNFVTRRLGRGAYEKLVEPLMSGIYAGDGDKLSLQATFPYLRELELRYGGLVKGALAVRRKRRQNGKAPTQGSRSVFLTPVTGLAEIVEVLVAWLEAHGVHLHLNSPVESLKRVGNGYLLQCRNEQQARIDALILATPAYVSARFLQEIAPELAAELDAIEYVSTATVSMAFDERDLPAPLNGYGYVIPRREGHKALACTWTSSKFPHRAPQGKALVRVFIGRAGDENVIPWNDEALIDIAREEIRQTMGISADPMLTRVFKFEKAMPQYNLGHPQRLERIESMLASIPDVALAGNGYYGIGIPDCIHSGEMAAKRVITTLFPDILTNFEEVKHESQHATL